MKPWISKVPRWFYSNIQKLLVAAIYWSWYYTCFPSEGISRRIVFTAWVSNSICRYQNTRTWLTTKFIWPLSIHLHKDKIFEIVITQISIACWLIKSTLLSEHMQKKMCTEKKKVKSNKYLLCSRFWDLLAFEYIEIKTWAKRWCKLQRSKKVLASNHGIILKILREIYYGSGSDSFHIDFSSKHLHQWRFFNHVAYGGEKYFTTGLLVTLYRHKMVKYIPNPPSQGICKSDQSSWSVESLEYHGSKEKTKKNYKDIIIK